MPDARVPEEQLPAGAGSAVEVPALPAASVLVLRGEPLEVLMIRRHEKSSFVPNAWVFPGGMVDDADETMARESGGGDTVDVMRVAGTRELFEETGVWLGAPLDRAEEKRRLLLSGKISLREVIGDAPVDYSALVWTSRWITPIGVPKRFDTYFFVVEAPPGAAATVDDREAVEAIWIAPDDALSRHRAGTFEMVFPTIRNLEALIGFETPADLIASRRGAEIPALQPRLVVENGRRKIVL